MRENPKYMQEYMRTHDCYFGSKPFPEHIIKHGEFSISDKMEMFEETHPKLKTFHKYLPIIALLMSVIALVVQSLK